MRGEDEKESRPSRRSAEIERFDLTESGCSALRAT